MISKSACVVFIMMGMCVTILFAGYITTPFKETTLENHQKLADCEAKLPRDQFCEIVAIPKVKK